MSNLIPIQITLQAANAADAKQLVQDLAATLSGLHPEQIPAQTTVSAYQAPVQPAQPIYPPQGATAQAYPPVQPYDQQPAYQAPVQPVYGGVPVQPPVQQQQPQGLPPQGVPITSQTYDIQQIAVAATALIDAGRHAEVSNLLQQQFGIQALTQLPKERYGEFATALRGMGARI